MGGAHLPFHASVKDIEEAQTVIKSQEMRVCTTFFGIFRICDWWGGAEDRQCQDGGHHEVVSAYQFFPG